ncbi:hypothetical protein GMSM_03510 [Geomonas sp. Red276]
MPESSADGEIDGITEKFGGGEGKYREYGGEKENGVRTATKRQRLAGAPAVKLLTTAERAPTRLRRTGAVREASAGGKQGVPGDKSPLPRLRRPLWRGCHH